MAQLSIEYASDSAVIVYLPDDNATQHSHCLSWLARTLLSSSNHEIIELTPSYQSLLVQFNPYVIGFAEVKQRIQYLYQEFLKQPLQEQQQGQLVSLPVYYDLSVGLDIKRIAELNNIAPEQVIELHQQQRYQVRAIGFAPGFAYLGDVDNRIATPRLATPRAMVPKGAVAIADRQTAVYPASSPGGWNIIGLCPVALFQANKDPVMPFAVGDTVQFEAVCKDEFLALGGKL